MAVRIKSRHVVKPAKPTENGIFPLSELQQTGFLTPTPIIYIYNKPTEESFFDRKKIIEVLKDSLSLILVPYYPIAGRLHWVGNGGRLKLECNAMGVELIEAESSKRVSDFGDFSSSYQVMFEGLVPDMDYKKPLKELPLLLVQLTWFECGGFGIGTALSHVVADGLAHHHFLMDWARLARGGHHQLSPYLDHVILDKSEDDQAYNRARHPDVDNVARLPTLIGATNHLKEGKKEVFSNNLILTNNQVDTLMKVAMSNKMNGQTKRDHDQFRYTRFEVIASHVWRCACRARGHNSQQMTALCFLVDSRSRVDPPLPERYLGDALVMGVVSIKAGDLISMPLSQVCQIIREKKETINNDYVRSLIKHFKVQDTLYKYQERSALGGPQGISFENPNLLVSSLLYHPVHGLDFGWGKEIYMGSATQQYDGDITIYPGSKNDGSVLVALGLQEEEHMEKFKKYFYEDIDEIQESCTISTSGSPTRPSSRL